MNNLKKRIWSMVLLVSLMLILANYMAIVDFVSHRSYTTFSDEELTGMFLVAEFIDGSEIILENDWPFLIEKYPYFKKGKLHLAELSNGQSVLVISKSYMGDFEVNKPIRGLFSEFPQEVMYLTEELDVEPYIFYCFENYLSRSGTEYLKPNLIALFAGLAGVIICMFRFLAYLFPEILQALLKKEERSDRKTRDSNFELLRIMCMIMIIMQHFGFWGEFEISGEITKNTIILQCIVNAGKIGVNCFMMITGYYCAYGTFKPSKITNLIARVWFYSWSIAIILFGTGIGVRSVENIIKSVFPICSGAFWFITVYLIVYVMSPYINKVIADTEQEKYRMLLVFLFIIWSVIPSVVSPGWEFSNTGWMIFMYLTGGYFRKYPQVCENCKIKPVLFFSASYAILMYLTFLWNDKVEPIVYHQFLAQKHTVPIVICSVALFVLFKNINIGQRLIINNIAASTFGVYLIHENPVLNDLLWTEWLKVNTYFGNDNFGLYAIGIIILVYLSCTIIDMILGNMMSFLHVIIKCSYKKNL